MGSFIPRPQIQPPEQMNPEGLVQLAMAIKQQKQQEAAQKKSDAITKLNSLTQNPSLLLMMDPKDVEKTFADAGYKLGSPEQVSAMEKAIQGGGGADAGAAPPVAAPQGNYQPNVSLNAPGAPNNLSALGAATQGNKSGAQSANPASPGAAGKAPGGGVTPGGIVTPGTGDLDQLSATAGQVFNRKLGALAPMYGAAISQQQVTTLAAHHTALVEDLKNRAAQGDVTAMGRLYLEAGKSFTDADMRGMLMSSNDPKVARQAMDFALGNETEADKSKREADILKTIMGSKDFMEKLSDPTNAPYIAHTIAETGDLPQGVQLKRRTLSELTEASTFAKGLMDQGFDPQSATSAADLRSQGLPYTLTLPKAMQGLTVIQSDTVTKRIGAQADLVRAQAAQKEAETNGKRLENELSQQKNKDLYDKLQAMTEADKAGYHWPAEVKQALLDQVASTAGLTPAEVSSWYDYVTVPFGLGAMTHHGYLAESKLPDSEKQQGTPAPKGTVSADPTMLEQLTKSLDVSKLPTPEQIKAEQKWPDVMKGAPIDLSQPPKPPEQ